MPIKKQIIAKYYLASKKLKLWNTLQCVTKTIRSQLVVRVPVISESAYIQQRIRDTIDKGKDDHRQMRAD
jgi:hypothetical protein